MAISPHWLLLCIIFIYLSTNASTTSTNQKINTSESLLISSVQESLQMVNSALERLTNRNHTQIPPMQMFAFSRQASAGPLGISKAAEVFQMSLLLLKDKKQREKRSLSVSEHFSLEEVALIANLSGCPRTLLLEHCPTGGDSEKYSTISGVCNNRNNPLWGAASTVLARWLPAEYEDGESQAKGWNTGHQYSGFQLPPVRDVSNHIIQSSKQDLLEDEAYSQLLVDYGQYIDHDISFTPQSVSKVAFLEGIDCLHTCENTNPCFPIQARHFTFAPRLLYVKAKKKTGVCERENSLSNQYLKIHFFKDKISLHDKLFGSKRCLPFFRSSPACQIDQAHTLDPQQMLQRQQMNSVTAFLDASTVYGHSADLQNSLRNLSSSEGLLAINSKYTDDAGHPYLPFVSSTPSLCFQEPGAEQGERVECFLAGDSRVNEILPLTALHTLWVREHNRIATRLKFLNAFWSSETTYQETRKIVGALHQIITMRDYIPKIIGKETFDQTIGPYEGYNDSVNPSVSNVFATAAFRFGHATIPAQIRRLNESFQEHEHFSSLKLHQAFFSPWRIIREGGLDPILRGLLSRPAPKQNKQHLMGKELTEKLVVLTIPEALDLAALNLQRGRDHGLPGYNDWREFCGYDRVESEADLRAVIGDSALVEKIMDLYGHPNNIDVWLGGLVEDLLPGARTGPLFACLIGKQMKTLREGDRFWWEKPGVFSPQQKQELQKHSLSRVFCDNSGVTEVPLDPFRVVKYPEEYLPCSSIPALDLDKWKVGPEEDVSDLDSTESHV